MGFDIKFGFGICICNKEEKSWVSNNVWICFNKETRPMAISRVLCEQRPTDGPTDRQSGL